MRNILLTLSYIGTAYHGSQVQKNALSVTEVVQNAMETVLHRREDVKGCSRTDSGVHALNFCCHFDAETSIIPEKMPDAFNNNLPEGISVIKCETVPEDFHARYDCKGKV